MSSAARSDRAWYVIDSRARAEVHLGGSAVEAGDAVRPQPVVQVGVVAVAEEWLGVASGESGINAPGKFLIAAAEHDTPRRALAQYRAALDSGADPAVVGQWITETQARKLAADARLRAAAGIRPGPERMTKEQIAATINAISDLMQALRHATAEDKAEIYPGLNLQLTYNPGERTVAVRAGIGQTCTKGS